MKTAVASPTLVFSDPTIKFLQTAFPTSAPTHYCPAGQENLKGSGNTCTKCVPGKFQSEKTLSQSCTLCDIGTYAGAGAVICDTCPAGRITPFIGATSDSQCISVAPNFAFGFISLFFVFFLILYVVFGFFGIQIDERKKIFLMWIKRFCDILDSQTRHFQSLQTTGHLVAPKHSDTRFRRLLKLVKILVFITVSVIATFVLMVLQVTIVMSTSLKHS